MVTTAPDIRADRVSSMLTRLDPVIARRVRRWSRMGAGDPDDLAQEGRIALLDALPKFDQSRNIEIECYASRVLDSRFGNLLRDALRWKRRPHIVDHGPNGRRPIACPTLHLESAASVDRRDGGRRGELLHEHLPTSDMDPEAVAIHAERLAEIARVLELVRARLSPVECRVLDAYLRPSAALLVTARNLGTADRNEISQIAIFLGLSHPTVDGALRRVRRLAASIAGDR